jgi:curved DNA-binding protein CbpA
MKLDSPLFDRIRVKPDQDRRLRTERPTCEWPNCVNAASHRAPKGRGRENEFFRFCLDHVREYNHSYNFFKGMSDDDVARFQKDALTGHRPTWKLGTVGGQGRRSRLDPLHGLDGEAEDQFGIFGEFGPRQRQRASAERERPVHNAARKALHSLGLEAGATRALIKSRFKELVKRHHPDANGGHTDSEEKLREIIAAYNYLKQAGHC